MKKFIVTLILFAFLINIKAQSDIEGLFKSPEMADIMRFGNVPVSKNAGRINLSVPLASLKDQDFDIQVSVNYNSAGYMPMKEDGIVGLDWSLSGVGVINREVKGYPDDMYLKDSYGFQIFGFMYFLKNKGKYDQNDFIRNHKEYIPAVWGEFEIPQFKKETEGNFVESNSDIYHFNFGEHSGKFMINFDGSVSVTSTSGAIYQVLLDEYQFAKFDNTHTIIKIITDDGYVYYFGGSYDNMEYSFTWTQNVDNNFGKLVGDSNFMPVISSFFLYKIKAPNGRELNISYKKLPSEYHLRQKFYKLELNESVQYKENYLSSFSWSSNSSTSASPDFPSTYSEEITHTLTKVALLEKIYTDDQWIDFTYTPREQERDLNNVGSLSFFELENHSGAKLTSIQTYTKGNTSTAQLSYHYTSGVLNRSFLTKVELSNIGIYDFFYNGISALPSGLTKNIDYWNYWRGDAGDIEANSRLIPSVKNINTMPPLEYTTNRREPLMKGYDLGMLSKVKYPTGGYTLFEYERHTYNRSIERISSTYYLPGLINHEEKKIAGGVRIKNIIDYGENGGKKNVTSYVYKDSLTADKSSGILNFKPEYYKRIDLLTGQQGSPNFGFVGYADNPFYYTIGAGFNLRSYESDHVTYSSVIEIRHDGKLKSDSTLSLIMSPWDNRSRIQHIDNVKIDGTPQIWRIAGSSKVGKSAIYIRGPVTKTITFDKSETTDNLETPSSLGLPYGNYSVYVMADMGSDACLWINYEDINLPKMAENGYIVSKFTEYKDFPDIIPEGYNVAVPLYEPYEKKIEDPMNRDKTNYWRYYKTEMVDRSIFRGKIKSEEVYNSDNKMISQTCYHYQLSDNVKINYIPHKLTEVMGTSITNYEGPGMGEARQKANYGIIYYPYFQITPVEFTPCLLQSKITKEYIYGSANPQIIETSETYTYKNDYLKSKIAKDSEGNTIQTHYTYSFEKEDISPYREMKLSNILNPVIEIENTKGGKTISVTKNNYSLISNLTDTEKMSLPVIISQESGKNKELLEVRTEYLKYDKYGNPIHVRKDNSTDIIYIWGYKGQYPIARIMNATYQEVANALGKNPEELSSMVSHSDVINIEALRGQLPTAQVSTYAYNPLIGLTSTTDPKGITTYFNYDSAGRLQEIYLIEDDIKQILQYQDYKYLNE